EMLRRRHLPQAQVARKAKRRQKAYETGGVGGDSAGSFPRGAPGGKRQGLLGPDGAMRTTYGRFTAGARPGVRHIQLNEGIDLDATRFLSVEITTVFRLDLPIDEPLV